jgi:Tol biopolymer transport system component
VLLLFFCGRAQAEYIAKGIKLTPLTDDGKSMAVSWAYQGDLVAFVRTEPGTTQSQLLIMRTDGSNETAVTPYGNPFFAEWSWAGRKLSYEFSNAATDESQAGVYVYDVPTGKSVTVSEPHSRIAFDEDEGPFWSWDDKNVVYVMRPGPARNRQVWIAEADSGRSQRILAERGQGSEARWSPKEPSRISLQVEASGDGWDIATVKPDGRDLKLLTDIGAEAIYTREPRWSPTGEWVAFTSNAEMTRWERELGRYDCWLARPDGSGARNLTQASSPATEEQIAVFHVFWSWDSRWIMCEGWRYDNLGSGINTVFLIDPINGGYEPILTSYPRQTGEYNSIQTVKWSYDSTKIAFIAARYTVKNWGPEPDFENRRWVLVLYDMETRKAEDILVYDAQIDRKEIIGNLHRSHIEDISWSPDNRSLLVTIATVISEDDRIIEPDVYRVDLPQRLISAQAGKHIGPPIGPGVTVNEEPVVITAALETTEVEPAPTISPLRPAEEDFVTETIRPMHMPIEEAIASLPERYSEYFTLNAARNVILFKGPAEALAMVRKDLGLIDTDPPHVLVDLLAVELSEEANRELGLDWTYTEGHFGFFQPVGSSLQQFPHDKDSWKLEREGFPSGAIDSLTTLPGVGQSFYQGVGTLPREFFIRLNTLVKDGDATILANPRTVALSGKESLINIRKTLNYFFNEGFDVSGRPIVKKSDISADTEGRITPTLLANGKIHLVVDIKVGSFTFTRDFGLPELTTRQSNTEVIVNEGDTIVIGGLRQQEMSRTVSKVPILGDLPLISPLFKREEEEVKSSVLTIFITPHVMQDNNHTPQWPQLNPRNHKIVPIMKETPKAEVETPKDDNDKSILETLDSLLERMEE